MRFCVGLLALWALSCGSPKATVEQETESAEPTPSDEPAVEASLESNGDAPRNTAAEAPPETMPSRPPPVLPAPQPSGDMDGMGAAGSPPVEPPHSEVIEVSDGSFTPGPPPAPAMAVDPLLSEIVNIVGPPAVTNGGAAILHVELSPAVPSPSFVVGLAGDTGYHTVTGADPDGDGIYDITVAVAATAAQRSLTLRVALRNAAGNVGPYRELTVPIIQSGIGDVKITLSWDRLHDLDLRVVEPDGEEIQYSNRSSKTGGQLDLDSGANCSQMAANSENIFWPKGGGPVGEYVVKVHNYQQCSAGPIDYALRVVYDNTVSTFRGTFVDGSASETDSADNPREVARFRR